MFDRIDPRSPTPLYEQIADRVRVAVATSELIAGQALPSVRQLAATLRVNPATVVQAYRALETEGFVDRRHGSGTYVRGMSGTEMANQREAAAAKIVREMLSEAARLGVSRDELWQAIDRTLGVGTHVESH